MSVASLHEFRDTRDRNILFLLRILYFLMRTFFSAPVPTRKCQVCTQLEEDPLSCTQIQNCEAHQVSRTPCLFLGTSPGEKIPCLIPRYLTNPIKLGTGSKLTMQELILHYISVMTLNQSHI